MNPVSALCVLLSEPLPPDLSTGAGALLSCCSNGFWPWFGFAVEGDWLGSSDGLPAVV
jgi:hypothetical protein